MQLMLFGHIVGIIVFLGCGLAACVVNRLALKTAEGRSLDDANGILSRLAGIGAGLIFLSGIGAIFVAAMSPAALLRQPWLSAMITLALVAAALTGIAGARARRLAASPPDAASARAARLTIWKLQLGFLIAGFGAVVCGIWRF
ncbi:MAG TPA: hypothetical protein VII38_14650 [Polyangia bacterium]